MRLSMILFSLALSLPLMAAGCQSTNSIRTTQATPMAASDSDAGSVASTAAPSNTHVAKMWVHGMACPQCSYNVDLQLLKVPGVKKVKIDMSTGIVVAQLSPTDPPTREQLVKAIEETGFTLAKIEM